MGRRIPKGNRHRHGHYNTDDYLCDDPNDNSTWNAGCLYRASKAVLWANKQTKPGIALAKGFSKGLDVGVFEVFYDAQLDDFSPRLPGTTEEEAVFFLLEVQCRIYSEALKHWEEHKCLDTLDYEKTTCISNEKGAYAISYIADGIANDNKFTFEQYMYKQAIEETVFI